MKVHFRLEKDVEMNAFLAVCTSEWVSMKVAQSTVRVSATTCRGCLKFFIAKKERELEELNHRLKVHAGES